VGSRQFVHKVTVWRASRCVVARHCQFCSTVSQSAMSLRPRSTHTFHAGCVTAEQQRLAPDGVGPDSGGAVMRDASTWIVHRPVVRPLRPAVDLN